MALAGVIAIYDDDDRRNNRDSHARACVPCLSGKGSLSYPLVSSSFALLFDDAPEPDDG